MVDLLHSMSAYALQARRTSQASATTSVCPHPNLEALKISGTRSTWEWSISSKLIQKLIWDMELSDLMSLEVRMKRIVVRLDWQTSRLTG